MTSVSMTASSEQSQFYLACRNGDTEFVRTYLKNSPSTKQNVNHREMPVNSTPLHAASYYGHAEVVRLLIEHGCDRSQVNGYGMTAYEEAANDEIRQLFRRPTGDNASRRFQGESVEDCFTVVKRPDEHEKGEPSNPTKAKRSSMESYQTEAEKQLEIGYATTSIAMCQSKLGRFIADKLQSDEPMSSKTMGAKLQEIIDKELIAKKDPESHKANDLLNKFLNDSSDERITQLIRLYTLETRFYSALKNNPIPLALPLYMTLQTLKDRHFQGESFRGAKMTVDEISTYELASQNRGSLLQTKHFSSTSLSRSIAEQFADAAIHKSHTDEQYRTLFIFNFTEKCDQAINLSRISDTQPGLSEFEGESEVLILPWTLFQVDRVKKDSATSSYIVNLSNVLLPQKNFLRSLKWILKHPRGCIQRFHENFPEKQPENVVKQLWKSTTVLDDQIPKRRD